jgi:hypothetical protein
MYTCDSRVVVLGGKVFGHAGSNEFVTCKTKYSQFKANVFDGQDYANDGFQARETKKRVSK